jgi:hypothetical protein
MAEPTLQWAPQSATVSLPPGGIQDVIVRFASSEQITKIDFTPVPALKGIVSVTPSSVGPIAVGGIEELIIRVSVPVKAKPGTVIDGTIQGRFSNGQKVIAKPLPVVISVSQPQSGVPEQLDRAERNMCTLLALESRQCAPGYIIARSDG